MDQDKMALAQALLGHGMARQAGNDLQSRPAYLQYVEQAQMQGQQPLPYPQWVQMMQQGGPQGGPMGGIPGAGSPGSPY